MSYYPKATPRKKMSKKKFEDVLYERYGVTDYEVSFEHGDDPDDPPVRLTLYYEPLREVDQMGLDDRHCGTWMSGECWEFLPEADQEKISSLGQAALPVTEDEEGSCRQIDAENDFLAAVQRVLPEDLWDDLDAYGLKATTEERVAYALQLVKKEVTS